ncbi:MAG: hypothetical protein WCL29_01500 [Pseudomonadota bacterium]
MNTNKLTIEQNAHELRRQEIARLVSRMFVMYSDAVRGQHEAWLRRGAIVVPRMKSVNGTPA